MNDPTDDILERAIRSHLRSSLDPHLGKARHALSRADPHTTDVPHATSAWRIGPRFALALAAALALGLGLAFVFEQSPSSKISDVSSNTGATGPTQNVNLVSTDSWWHTYDDGVVVLPDQTPARQLRRVQYEQTRWVDPSGAVKSKTISPRQDIIFIDMETQ